jgi:hypothetical protein
MPGGFPLQDTGPGMSEMFHDLQIEQEQDRMIRCHKPQFIRWTDWILDGDAVSYGGGSYNSPSACRWIIPGTGEQRWY